MIDTAQAAQAATDIAKLLADTEEWSPDTIEGVYNILNRAGMIGLDDDGYATVDA